MSDFQSLWAQATQQRFDNPADQKAFDKSRLDQLTTAVVTQAMWKAAKTRVLFFIFGFIFFPPVGFWAGTKLVEGQPEPIYAAVGLACYALAGILTWLIGRRFIEGDPDEALRATIQPLLVAEAEYKKKWGPVRGGK